MSKHPRELVASKETKTHSKRTGNATRPAWVIKTCVADQDDETTPKFRRRRSVGNTLTCLDQLSVSGRNGILKPLDRNENQDNCEICAPLDRSTPGVICTLCQQIVDDKSAEVIEVPVHLLV